MKPIKPRSWKFVKFNWTRLIVAPSKERRAFVPRGKQLGSSSEQETKQENASVGPSYDRRLSRVKTSIRERSGRNPLTSGRGNSLYRCGETDHGEKRSSRAAGIRGSLKATSGGVAKNERSYRNESLIETKNNSSVCLEIFCVFLFFFSSLNKSPRYYVRD